MVDREFHIKCPGDQMVLPFSIFVGFYDSPRAAAVAAGDHVPAGVDMLAATFTHDDVADPDDATMYFPHDAAAFLVAHEVVHSAIGIYSRRGLHVPGRQDSAEDEEVFAHTVSEMFGMIIDARDHGSDGDG